MKRIVIALTMISLFLCLFSGCDISDPAKVEREVVEAVVVDSGRGRGGSWIQVAYDGAVATWKGEDLYSYYHTRHGATIQCVLVTYTYESGRTKRMLMYNQDIE